MKYIIGFIFGLMIASAMAGVLDIPTGAVLMAARGPDGKAAIIEVDANGHVICSDIK